MISAQTLSRIAISNKATSVAKKKHTLFEFLLFYGELDSSNQLAINNTVPRQRRHFDGR